MLSSISVLIVSASTLTSTFSFFNLSLSSKIILCADFFPIPGSFVSLSTSSEITASAKVDGSIFESIATADFAPIPLTPINNSNILNSSLVLKPYKLMSSSLTFIYV